MSDFEEYAGVSYRGLDYASYVYGTATVEGYLSQFTLSPEPEGPHEPLVLTDPMDLITLAQWYFKDDDLPSMLGCIYLFVSLKKRPAPDDVREVCLGPKILRRWYFYKRRLALEAQQVTDKKS